MRSDPDPNASPARSEAGFTLIEIMVVVTIMGLLAAIVAHNVIAHGETAKVRTAETTARILHDAARLFFVDNGRVPELTELLGADGKKIYLEELTPDPWGHPYELIPGDRAGRFEITSPGPNGISGDEDDVHSRRAAAER